MRFSEAMQTVTRHADGWQATVSEDWLQGRSAFGGLQAALALRAMRELVPADMPLRTLQATFIAPVPVGTVDIRARLLRQGRSAIQVEASLCDGEQTLCQLVGVFGNARPSTLDFQPMQSPVENATAPELRYVEGRMPAFTQHFGARWLRRPLAEVRQRRTEMECREATPVARRTVIDAARKASAEVGGFPVPAGVSAIFSSYWRDCRYAGEVTLTATGVKCL